MDNENTNTQGTDMPQADTTPAAEETTAKPAEETPATPETPTE